MAFATKYRGTFYNSFGATIKVDIQTDGYSGSILPLVIKDVNISHNWNNYFESAIGVGCEVEIVNNNSQWDYLDELMTAYERQFKMIIYFTYGSYTDFVLFDGYLLTEEQEQKILKNSIISLKASNYIKQLEGLDSIEAFQQVSLNTPMRYIAQILEKTGMSYDIYVNCSLYETSMVNNRLMTELYIQRHFFWENDEPMKLLEALNKLLVPFNMYVYAYNQKWYIERYGDLYEAGSSNSYLKYNPSTYDVYTSTGSSSVSYNFIDSSPDSSADNITSAYVDNYSVDITIYNFRTWASIPSSRTVTAITSIFADTLAVNYTAGGISRNDSSSNISISNISFSSDTLSFRVTATNQIFDYGIPESLDSVSLSMVNESPYAVVFNYNYTAPVTLSETPTVITAGTDFEYINRSQVLRYGRGYKNITVKCNERDSHNLTSEYYGDAASHSKTNTVPSVFEKWYYDSSGSLGSTTAYDKVVFLHTIDDYWRGIYCVVPVKSGTENNILRINYRVQKTDMGVVENYANCKLNVICRSKGYQLEKNSSNEWVTASINTTNGDTEIHVTDLKYDPDEDYYYWEVNETIDLAPLGLTATDQLEIRLLAFNTDYANYWSFVYRKIRITQESTEEEVVLEGDISNNYSGTLNVDIELFDTEKYYGSNAMFLDTTFPSTLTEEWLDKRTAAESPTRSLSLQEHLLEDMYQYFNKPRKRLVASIKYDKPLKPFSIIKDSNVKRDGSVINMTLLKYTLNVPTMVYDVEADEYVTNDNLKIV